MQNSLSPAEQLLQRWMLLSAWMYFLAGWAFVLFPRRVFDLVNTAGATLSFAPMPYQVERFWLALSFSMMMTITALSYVAKSDVRHYRYAIVAVLISKLVSSGTALIFFLTAAVDERFFGYLIITVVDGSILVVTFLLFRQARSAVA
ncbi:MAG: hypothetical protein L0338_30555 [Acidobacteria bacterium]|nr:hypothetical protein [Acidobacteriota bacterium]